ncbi:MAG: MerR family transcriptional regulator [Acidobacteria bacterium]|nr:MerR family transcriptional regulator [Acidobacteriota bacterium]
MKNEPVEIPDKLFFKIGEVCDLVGVQAHVLRYWETEFSMLSPQKNKSGQRSYRKKDVETALRIKQLLYDDMFTIAGARKKLISDQREANRPKMQEAASAVSSLHDSEAPTLFDSLPAEFASASSASGGLDEKQVKALQTISSHLYELKEMLNRDPLSIDAQ